MRPDASPTARALLALELIQGSPGISAALVADKLGELAASVSGSIDSALLMVSVSSGGFQSVAMISAKRSTTRSNGR